MKGTSPPPLWAGDGVGSLDMDNGNNMRGISSFPPCGKGGLGAWTMMME